MIDNKAKKELLLQLYLITNRLEWGVFLYTNREEHYLKRKIVRDVFK